MIVGGGIVGCALAYHLAAAGMDGVVVVEGDTLGSGATAHSMGGVRQQFSTPLEIELSRRALAFWRDAEGRFGSPCAFHRDGYLFVSRRPAILDDLRAAADLQRRAGVGPVEVLDAAGVGEVAPWLTTADLAGGTWTPHDGRANPTDGLTALVRAARELGVAFVEHWPVEAIDERAGGLVVRAAGGVGAWGVGEVGARVVVVAAGLASPALLRPFGVDLDIRPQRLHYAMTGPALDGLPVPLTIDLDSGLIVERAGRGLAVSILHENAPPGYGADDMLADFAEAAMWRAPALGQVGVLTTAFGMAELSVDGHPYAGQVADGVWTLAGFGGHGTMHGPVLAELLAGHVVGDPDLTVDLTVLDPHRRAPSTRGEWMVASRKG